MAIQILVDSASGYTALDAAAQGLFFVPLSFTIGGKSYSEGVDITPEEFYKLLESGEFPKTSQPAPQDYLECYLKAKAKGDEVLVISLSAKLSGSYQSANIARDMSDYADHIRVVDSFSFSAGIQLLAKEALAKRATLSLEDLAKDLEALCQRIRVYAGLDSLEYLYKGGRLSKLNYALGMFLHVKAIGACRDGMVAIAGKALGSKNAMAFIIEQIEKEPIDFAYPAYPIYTSDKSLVDRFIANHLKPAYPNASFMDPLQIDPVIGSHVGPFVYGFFYVKEEKTEKKETFLERIEERLRKK